MHLKSILRIGEKKCFDEYGTVSSGKPEIGILIEESLSLSHSLAEQIQNRMNFHIDYLHAIQSILRCNALVIANKL